MPQSSAPAKLSVFSLMMINVAAVLSLRALPGMAEYGYTLISYLALTAVCFFLPSSLVSAELASAWKEDGGVYLWVKEAFGSKWGFVAVFMQWVENLPFFPAVLAFAASDIAYTVYPPLADNRIFVALVIWVTMWLATLLNFRDMKLSAFFSSTGAVIGTIIPGLLIIVLGVIYLGQGRPVQIAFSTPELLPDFGDPNQLMLIAAMLMSFLGMEMSAVHVNEVENPARNYPRAIFAACAIIMSLSLLGSLAIAFVIPADGVSLSAGVCQAFAELFKIHGLPFMTPIIAFLMAYGALAAVVTWMAGPAKGILEVAREGYLPSSWRRTNKYGMPTTILIVQAAFSSLLAVAVLFMPTVSSAFMLMSALAAQLYLVMYLLMFAAAIRLRYSKPDLKRGYSIPGGMVGIWLVCGLAMAASLFIIVCGFIPPEAVEKEGGVAAGSYVAFLAAGMVIFTGVPLYFHQRAQRQKRNEAL
jgi:putative glutamate/gamma-aminobutyrate antiporter